MTDPTPRPDAAPDALAAIERVRVSLAGGYVLRFIDPGDVAALLAAHDALTADLARLRAPADLAAIEALSPEMQYDADEALGVYAQATTNGINRANARGLLRMRGVEYVGALLAHIAAERERHAAEVAAARAEALREAEDACRDVGDDYDPRCRERVGAHACAAAVAALGTKGGGA